MLIVQEVLNAESKVDIEQKAPRLVENKIEIFKFFVSWAQF
jgi:hypothetical protein